MRIVAAIAALSLVTSSAAAQTFGGHSMQLNGSGGNGTPQITGGGTLQLMNDAYGSASSAFTTGTFDFTVASTWSTSFRLHYAYTSGVFTSSGGDGIAFVMQSGAATAVGGGGGSMGYEGIGNSVAVAFRSFWDDVLLGQNGAFDGTPIIGNPAGLGITPSGPQSDYFVDVLLSYDGLGMFDLAYTPSYLGSAYTANHAVDVGSLGSTVRIGFTAGSGAATQLAEVDHWQFSGLNPSVVATPEPATMILTATGLLAVVGIARRRRTA